MGQEKMTDKEKLLELRYLWFQTHDNDERRKLENEMIEITQKFPDHGFMDDVLPKYGWDMPCMCGSCSSYGE
jgi:hypothetical protein